MRVLFVAIFALLTASAGTAEAGSKKADKRAEQAEKLNTTLSDFQSMKTRERTLKILIRRSKGNRQAEYTKEFDELRPRIYEAAQTMEKEVLDFERVYGRKILCRSVKPEVRSVVGVCPKK